METVKLMIDIVIAGLYEKENKAKKGAYSDSEKLIHGMNLFYRMQYKYAPHIFHPEDVHEQAFLTKYATKPIAEWFTGWDEEIKKELEKEAFYQMDAPIVDTGFQTYQMSDDGEDYLEYVETDIVGGNQQREIYLLMMQLNQEQYVDLRKFIIEHPIITQEELVAVKLKYFGNEWIDEILEKAYEEIKGQKFICPKCGWTMHKDRDGYHCVRKECISNKYEKNELERIPIGMGKYRLKKGVMKYMAIPGKLELNIYEYCLKHKVKAELWPEKDTFDIRITFDNGEVLAVDAKAVKNPYFLRQKIIEDGGFPRGDYTKGMYVVPNEAEKNRAGYLEIINDQLFSMPDKQISCIKLSKLKKIIKRGFIDEENTTKI